MKARTYSVIITGQTPLLLHHDNLQWAEAMKTWANDPANRSESIAGDDRSPAFRWIGCLYVENDKVVIPSDNLMTVIREGGKRCPTGKGQTTFKSQSQSGLVVDQSAWPIIVNGNEVPYGPVKALIGNKDFSAHEATAVKCGFELFVKRAKIGAAKHVRVRPRFNVWSASGTVTVFDEQISTSVLQNIWSFAGTYAGMGDWRPSSPKSPGSFGKFTAAVKEV